MRSRIPSTAAAEQRLATNKVEKGHKNHEPGRPATVEFFNTIRQEQTFIGKGEVLLFGSVFDRDSVTATVCPPEIENCNVPLAEASTGVDFPETIRSDPDAYAFPIRRGPPRPIALWPPPASQCGRILGRCRPDGEGD